MLETVGILIKFKTNQIMKITHLFIACLLLASCSKKSGHGGDGEGTWGEQPALPVVTGQQTFDVPDNIHYVNVMPNNPRMPNFPSASVKKGYARGYVADLSGKPIKGANISVRASLTGTFEDSGTATTNDNGYYEIKIPTGATNFFGTAVTINYGESNAVLALSPIGGLGSFPSGDGIVKNFVLLSYGLGNPDDLNQYPNHSTNYYGGSVYINYNLNYPGDTYPTYIPLGGVVEIELIPEGSGLYGETKSFRVNKTIGNISGFSIVNIPVGKYTIKAKLRGRGDLKMTASGPHANDYQYLGLKPDNAIGTSTVMFTPIKGVTPGMVANYKSNWEAVSIWIQAQ
jgi:hypothetical protein